MRMSLFFFLILLSLLVNAGVRTVDTSTVIGKWVTFDKKSHKVSSIISIRRRGAYVTGRIIKTYAIPGEKRLTRCQHCRGDRRNKPILGLDIIRGMRCQKGRCYGGTILDPRDGKVYRANMRLINRGRSLKVRGYIGVSLFGKTVVWERLMFKHRRY